MSVSLVPGYVFIGSTIQFGIDGTNYCGPNYSNGEYGAPPDPNGPTTGPIDTLCKIHDLAYEGAKNSANPAELRLVADQNLIADMQALMDSGTLSAQDRTIAGLVIGAFVLKMDGYDIPTFIIEAAQRLLGDILDSLGTQRISVPFDVLAPGPNLFSLPCKIHPSAPVSRKCCLPELNFA